MTLATPANDHDLLVRLDTKLDALSLSFAEVKIAVAAKADASRVEKLEASVEVLKTKAYGAAGALAALQFVLHWFLK
jgi:hypothetical protein